jgi:hypothetical protein
MEATHMESIYESELLIDSEEFVPEIATPQELKVEVIQEEIE